MKSNLSKKIAEYLGVILFYAAVSSFVYNLYKVLHRGQDYLARYLGDRAAEILGGLVTGGEWSLELRTEMRDTYPWVVLVFVVAYFIVRNWRGDRRMQPLPFGGWLFVLTAQAVVSAGIFHRVGGELLLLLGSSTLVCLLLLVVWQLNRERAMAVSASIKALIRRFPAQSFQAGVLLIVVYTVSVSYYRLSGPQWALLFLAMAGVVGCYRVLGMGLIDRRPLQLTLVFTVYSLVGLALFHESLGSIFRSDYWLILTLFNRQEGFSFETVKNISLFEMFGDIRFQPLAHLLMYLRHLAFGNHVVLYNLLNLALHVVTAFLVFLILARLLKEARISFLFGAWFLALFSQFDTVVWTYHIYIVVGTIFTLACAYMVYRYVETEERRFLVLAATAGLLSLLLYEAAVFVLAAIPLLVLAAGHATGRNVARKEFVFAVVTVLAAYAFYVAFTAYGVSLEKPSGKMSLRDLLGPEHVFLSTKAVLTNLWASSFVKNVGVLSDVKITDIVHLSLEPETYRKADAILKILLGLVLLGLIRPRRTSYFAVLLLAVGLSYVFIIALGRLLTNDAHYLMAQPRYQYFPNVFALLALALLLADRVGQTRIRRLTVPVIIAMIFWNAQNVLYANNKVHAAMRPIDGHYQRIAAYLAEHPDTTVFIDMIPDTHGMLFLGTDIALDNLFGNWLTKSIARADYIYDGNGFTKNPRRRPGGANTLGDFTASWMYMHDFRYPPKSDIVVIGSGASYPRVSLTPDGYVKVQLLSDNPGVAKVWLLKHGYIPNANDEHLGDWFAFTLEKHGGSLCLYRNGDLVRKVRLDGTYKNWDRDSDRLLGSYFTGNREIAFISRLSMQFDVAKYGCGSYPVGRSIAMDIKRPW